MIKNVINSKANQLTVIINSFIHKCFYIYKYYMSSSIQDIQQNNDENESNPIIDEILKEMNEGDITESPSNDSPSVVVNQQPEEQISLTSHTMDNNIDMNNLQVPYENQVNKVNENNENKEMPSKMDLLKLLQKPLVVFVLSFIIFSPAVLTYLSSNIPKLFSSVSPLHYQYIGTMILSLILSLFFGGSEYLLN